MIEKRNLLTKARVAELLGVSRPYVYTLIKKAGLPTTPDGRIDSIALQKWLDCRADNDTIPARAR